MKNWKATRGGKKAFISSMQPWSVFWKNDTIVINLLATKQEVHLKARQIPILIQMMEGQQVRYTTPNTTKGG
jgi:hypothetical protein